MVIQFIYLNERNTDSELVCEESEKYALQSDLNKNDAEKSSQRIGKEMHEHAFDSKENLSEFTETIIIFLY